jgi:O-acetylserine/cysteine efflux transporter
LRRRIDFSTFRSNIRFFLSIGFLVAASTTFNYIAVGYIDPGTASMLAQSATLFALGLGVFWLREKLAGREITGALIALAGVFIVSFQPGDYLRLGSLLVLASAFMYALHSAIVKRHGGQIEFGNFFFFRVLSVSGFLLLFTAARGQLVWPSWEAWRLLILAGTVDVVISRVLYYLALRRLQLSFLSIILTLSPVITILWSIALFGEKPTVQGFIGGAAVIVGVLIVSSSKSQESIDQ